MVGANHQTWLLPFRTLVIICRISPREILLSGNSPSNYSQSLHHALDKCLIHRPIPASGTITIAMQSWISMRLHRGGPQGANSRAEVVADILACIKERRT
jgi:hypothetical protein